MSPEVGHSVSLCPPPPMHAHGNVSRDFLHSSASCLGQTRKKTLAPRRPVALQGNKSHDVTYTPASAASSDAPPQKLAHAALTLFFYCFTTPPWTEHSRFLLQPLRNRGSCDPRCVLLRFNPIAIPLLPFFLVAACFACGPMADPAFCKHQLPDRVGHHTTIPTLAHVQSHSQSLKHCKSNSHNGFHNRD